MKTFRAATVCVVLLLAVLGSAFASAVTLTGSGEFALQLVASTPILAMPAGAGVSGELLVTPAAEVQRGLSTTFYVDNAARLASGLSRPEYNLDTTRLSEGLHELRVDVFDGMRLVCTTGPLALHIMNQAVAANLLQGRTDTQAFNKVYRKEIMREIVWFDNREADLEKHAFRRDGQLYITLTDLMRHLGGNIIWGPDSSWIRVERPGVKVQVHPGSPRVAVNGEAQSLGQAAFRIDSRTYVPIRPMLKIFGIGSEWNTARGRLDITVNRR